MSSRNLLSKEWCNLIFDGRNKDYGAYQIRQNMGRRYFFALSVVIGALMLIICLVWSFRLLMARGMQEVAADLEKEMAQMKKVDVEMGHDLKIIAGGRPRPRLPRVEHGTTQVPEIVDVTKNDIKLGIDEDYDELTEAGADFELEKTYETIDSLYEKNLEELPYEQAALQPTEVVEQMPQFPGGIRALMRWLDDNIVYPQRCLRLKIGGELQVSFLVDVNGVVQDASIDFSLHPDLDRAVLNAIRRMPRWTPGRVNGKVSVVSVTLPVHFRPR